MARRTAPPPPPPLAVPPDAPQLAQPAGVSFRLFGFPVRFNLSFLLVGAVLMYSPGRSLSTMLTVVGIFAVSVLWHELGHAVALRAFGHESEISLAGIVGLTVSDGMHRLSNVQALVVAAAGPGAGLLLAGVAQIVRDSMFAGHLRHPLDLVVLINVFINLFNLIPVFPLDGGRIVRALMDMASPRYGEKAASAVSLVAAAIGILWSVNHEMELTALMLLGVAGMNFTILRTRGRAFPLQV